MTEWQELPTHEGWWWVKFEGQKPELCELLLGEYPPGTPYVFDTDSNMKYGVRDDIRYQPVSPPRDGEKLPRRFRWKGLFGMQYANGLVMCPVEVMSLAGFRTGEQWLSDHESEIEWID